MVEKLDVVEKIRAEVLALDFEPLDDKALAEMKANVLASVNNNEIENSFQDADEVALDEMLLEVRAPQKVRMFAARRLIEEVVNDGKALKGVPFEESLDL